MSHCYHPTQREVNGRWQCVDCQAWIDLGGPGLSRRGDRATSKAAASQGLGRKLTQRTIILGYFYDAEDGLIHGEIGDYPDVADTAHRTRCRELEKSGYIEETERTRITRSGAEATVWVITDAGVRALEAWMQERAA